MAHDSKKPEKGNGEPGKAESFVLRLIDLVRHPKKNFDSLLDILIEKINQRSGLTGLVIFLILFFTVIFLIYLYGNFIQGKIVAGLTSLYAYCTRPGIPRADPGCFTILVANFEGDEPKEFQILIQHDFHKFKGIKVLLLDETIPLNGIDKHEKERQGYAKAQEYLRRSGAQVLIWGGVRRKDNQNYLCLYWVLSKQAEKEEQFGNTYESSSGKGYRLPVVVWEDLAKTLQLLIFNSMTAFEGREGQYVADQLEPFINKVRTLLAQSANRPGWDETARADTALILASALRKLGNQKGEPHYFREALQYYEQALQIYSRDEEPLQLAIIQHNYGVILFELGEPQTDNGTLKKAENIYRQIIEADLKEQAPLLWAMSMNNLGSVLRQLAWRVNSFGLLLESETLYRQALEEVNPKEQALLWAFLQDNLGIVLSNRGQREHKKTLLKEALAVYQDALTVRTRQKYPLAWASTRNNMGNAFLSLGELEAGPDGYEEVSKIDFGPGGCLRKRSERRYIHLEAARAAFAEALEEFPRDRLPLYWAQAQFNLGGRCLP